MLWNHNTQPPSPLRQAGSFVAPGGKRISYSAATDRDYLRTLGVYPAGDGDPIPDGHQVVTEERVIRDGFSVMERTTELAPVEPPALTVFGGGIETPSIIIPHAGTAGHDCELTVVDGVAVATQISASPRKSEAERAQIKAQRAQVVSAKLAQLKALKGKNTAKDIADRLDAIEAILGLS